MSLQRHDCIGVVNVMNLTLQLAIACVYVCRVHYECNVFVIPCHLVFICF